jgi:hypothetical protein
LRLNNHNNNDHTADDVEEADWPNMEERNAEGRKDGDRKRNATKYRH